MGSLLIIGYGNANRRDDGVAFHIVWRLREQLGLPSRPLDDDGTAELGQPLAMLALHQLAPELAETLAQYDTVVFIDAHVEGVPWAPIHWEEIVPAYRSGMVSHHLKPETVLALCQSLYARCPRGYILSVLGADFDFGDTLSAETSALADQAVERLRAFIETNQGTAARERT